MIRALFVCSTARHRGPTAAQIFGEWPGISTDFAGVGRDAGDEVGVEQIEWATLIFVMEQRQTRALEDRFGARLRGKRIVNLAIQDRYTFMQAALIEVLMEKAAPHLRGV